MPSCDKLFLLVTFLFCALACDKKQSAPTTKSSQQGKITVVSLSPAATDLILAMGGAEQLVGVSTFDDDPAIKSLPKVGDYENVDWERIIQLRPQKMIVQMKRDRIPLGMKQRASELDISLVTVQIDRFADVIVEINHLGMELNRKDESKKLFESLREEVDEIRRMWEESPKVRTLIVTNDDGTGIAGAETYLNDCLEYASGENVAKDHKGYFKADREMLITMKPDVIVQLLPDATPAQLDEAKKFWQSLPTIPAVVNDRILVITEPWALRPNAKLGELTRKISAFLHPGTSTGQETNP